MQIFAKTDKGKVRSINQDAFYINTLSDGSALAVVCDGMGGANAGDIASKTAVEIISQYILNGYNQSMSSDDITRLINNAITSANLEVYALSQKDEQLRGMGTTAVVAVVRNTEAIICNVGDSRAYLIDNELKQITRDHSVVQTLIESGEISPEDAALHPRKNVITRALGVEADVAVDTAELVLAENETLLLCTDGLTNFVTDENILETFKQNDVSLVPEKLIELANAGGGGDNITAVTLTK